MSKALFTGNTSPIIEATNSSVTNGHVPYVVTCSGIRKGSVAYRTGINATDLNAAMSAPSVADVATGGSLLPATAYNCSVAGGNQILSGKVSANGTVTTANDSNSTHVVRATIPSQTGCNYYDIFLSTDAAPKFVGRITETQRSTAGCRITAQGVVDNAGANAAGTCDIQCAGTGNANNALPWSTTTGALNLASVSSISTGGYTTLAYLVRFNPTNITGGTPAVTFTMCCFLLDPAYGDYALNGTAATPGLGLASTIGSGNVAAGTFPLNGATTVKIGVTALTLSNCAGTFDIFVDLL